MPLALSCLDLRRRLEAFAARMHVETVLKVPMVNDADPHSFNYSIEAHLLLLNGSYFGIDRHRSFSVIQPCIRRSDLTRLYRGDLKRLSAFDMAALTVRLDPDRHKREVLQREGITQLVQFLIDDLGLEMASLTFTFFGGGTLRQASGGAIPIDQYIERDSVTEETLRHLGFRAKQLIAQCSMETFLATFPAPVDYWAGYRYEVFYHNPIDGGKFEIATGEALDSRRVTDSDGRTRRIEDALGSLYLSVAGVERLLMSTNTLRDAFDCDHIAPVVNAVHEATAGARSERNVRILTDCLRALHFVIADGYGFSDLTSRRLKQSYSQYFGRLADAAARLGVADTNIRAIASANARAQPWYRDLAGSVDLLADEFVGYLHRRFGARRAAQGRAYE